MIQDIETLEPGATLRADACVIGTGHAGMEAILALRRAGLSVVVAEGGRRGFSKAAQALTRMEVVGRPVVEPDPSDELTPYLAAELRGEARIRQLGGNSNIWTGKWREFEPLDFEPRPHVPDSGWPLAHEDLLPWYREVERDYGFPDFSRLGEDEALAPLHATLAGSGIATTYHYWEAEPRRVVERHGAEVEADRGVRVVLGANAVELGRGEGGRIERLRARSLEGREIHLEADHFVVALGGIESARLLLASDRRDAGGIGNARDLVGRCFMDHPKLKRGRLHPGPRFGQIPDGAANFPRPRVKLCFSLDEATQAREGLLNHILQLAPTPPEERCPRAALRRRRWGAAARLALGRRARGRGDGLSGEPVLAAFIVEQAPNRDSRVRLSDERDALGMRRTVLDWRLTDLDARSFARTLELLGERLAAAGIGRLDYGDRAPSIEETIDCYHHMGTTRMGATPETGVVDTDCRVFGAPNLFVASSAVFPTGHSYGPTLTIVALARKAAAALVRDRGAAPALRTVA